MHGLIGRLRRKQLVQEDTHAGERLRVAEFLELQGGLSSGVFFRGDGEFGPLVEDLAGLDREFKVSMVTALRIWGNADRADGGWYGTSVCGRPWSWALMDQGSNGLPCSCRIWFVIAV